ncbi:hypothetical protein [Rhizobium ruizarguesonis]|uniref:hypothetical protein n=1 Tax=Rhizobium ruizarguesonis TaxID=2081791 RepID=UPI001FEEFCF7|nr:hypothetical protein [Rhizobium ruizarguesonis]
MPASDEFSSSPDRDEEAARDLSGELSKTRNDMIRFIIWETEKMERSTGMHDPRYTANRLIVKWSISMPSLAQINGSLHIHNFYIGKLKAKQEQLFASDPELVQLLGNVAEVLSEHVVTLADEIAELEYEE